MAIGFVAIMAFNLVDTWFVSRLGTHHLAAIGLTFPVIMVVGSFARGLGMGTTSVVSRAIGGAGAHGTDEVRRLTTDALSLGVVIVALVSVTGYLTIDPLFTALGADEQTLPLVREYMEIWYLGTIFLVVPMIGNAAIRASGDTRTPAAVMVLAGAMNAALDPLLIFGWGPIPAMGMRGAAIATVIGRAATLLVALWVLGHKHHMLGRPHARWVALWPSWRRVLTIALPASASNLAKPLMVGVMTALAAGFGAEAVAALAAGGRVEIIAVIPLMSLGAGLVPFIGQNWGAGHHHRVAAGMRAGAKAALIIGLIAASSLALLAHPIATLFSRDPVVIDGVVLYLRVMPLSHVALGLMLVAAASFNAIGRPLTATAINGLQAALTWALATAGAAMMGLGGVFAGAATAVCLAGLGGWWWARPLWRHVDRG